MKYAVESVLYAEATDSNLKSLRHESNGQYDFRYGTKPEFGEFFKGVAASTTTPLGGFDLSVPIASFDGENPVPAAAMVVRNMGPKAARGPDVYVRAVQPGSGYALWTAPRAFSTAVSRDDLLEDVALIIRDTSGQYHARWIRNKDRAALPPSLNSAIRSNKKGVWMPPQTSTQVSPLVRRVVTALREHTNVLLYGPPATGKTQLVSDVRAAFSSADVILDSAEERKPISAADGAHSAWVTFHQSYSYEDFIVGLRPEPSEAGQGFSLIAQPGVLLELSEWVRKDPSTNEALLVIDEINRGNVSRIFGEFITLMEANKRTDAAAAVTSSTVAVRLPHSTSSDPIVVTLPDGAEVAVPQPFTMPQQLYTLATMNSVDKSVAPLDAALRRRFHVIALRPQFDLLEPNGAPKALKIGIKAMKTLNRRIAGFLGPDFEFGHWFLASVAQAPSEPQGDQSLVALWRNQVFPQLEEHFIGRPEQLLAVLGPASATDPFEVVAPEPEAEAQGATAFVRDKIEANEEVVLDLWRRLAKVKTPA